MANKTATSLDLSICIVGHQRCQMLADCLESIYRHVQELHFEVIVVDNASTDGTADMVRTRFPQVCLLVNQEPRSFAENNNIMLQQAAGRHLLLLNDDTYLTHDAFKAMVEFIEAHSKAGAVGCRHYNALGQPRPSAGRFPTALNVGLWAIGLDRLPFMRTRYQQGEITSVEFYATVQAVDWLVGACLMVRRAVWETVGGLDESWGMFSEDLDWCFRIKRAGYEIYTIPQASIVHYSQGGNPTSRRRSKVWANRSLVMYFRKYQPRSARWIRRLLMLGAALRMGVGRVLRHIKPYHLQGEELHQTYSEVWATLAMLENI